MLANQPPGELAGESDGPRGVAEKARNGGLESQHRRSKTLKQVPSESWPEDGVVVRGVVSVGRGSLPTNLGPVAVGRSSVGELVSWLTKC